MNTLANKEVSRHVLTNIMRASSGIKRLLLHLETLFFAAEESSRGEFRDIRDELEWLFEDQGMPGSSEPRESMLDEANAKLQPVEHLLDEVVEELFDIPLFNAGPAFAPCNAHSQAWLLAFQIKLKYLELRSNAAQILDYLRSLSPDIIREAVHSEDPDLMLTQPDFPWRLRHCESTPAMLRAELFLFSHGGICPASVWDVCRGSFLKFIEDLGPLDFGALRMRVNKEAALARRFVTEGRISEVSLALAGATPEKFLGLDVDASERRVCRSGCEPVHFGRYLKAWELFYSLCNADRAGATLDELMGCLWPSKAVQPNNLDQQKRKANGIIECLGIEVTSDSRGVWHLSQIA